MSIAAPAGRHRAPAPLILPAPLRRLINDALYRGSALLLANTAVLSVFGLMFWAMAARTQPADHVGAFSALTSGVNLLTAVAAVGVPNLLIRYLKTSIQQRTLITGSLAAVAAIGGVTTLAAITLLDHLAIEVLPPATDSHTRAIVVALVVVGAASAAIDAGLVAFAAHTTLLLKNVVGGAVRLAILLLGGTQHTNSLVEAYTAGAVAASAIALIGLLRRTAPTRRRRRRFRQAQTSRQRRFSAGNYLGTIFGILPMTMVPLLIVHTRGPAEAAWYAVAALLVSFLNVIPAVTSQVLFAQTSAGTASPAHLTKALHAIYGLLLPAAITVFAFAPYLLLIFGADYTRHATWCLRGLATAAAIGAANYVIDTVVIATDNIGRYITLNAANAALVIAAATTTVEHGLAAVAAAIAIAQLLSLLLGLATLKTTRNNQPTNHANLPPEASTP